MLFSFFRADYTTICSEVLSTIILAFLANLVESILPRGKRLFGWFFFRVLTVVLAIVAHLAVTWLFTRYLPQGLVTYAPTILLALLGTYSSMFVIGALTLATEWHRIRATTAQKASSLFVFPLFMMTFVPIALTAVFRKFQWQPIAHTVAISAKDINP